MRKLFLIGVCLLALSYGGKSLAANSRVADSEVTDQPTRISAEKKDRVIRKVLGMFERGAKIDPALYLEFVKAQTDGLRTGPKVGERVPDFTLPDPNGTKWSLRRLMGPKGLLLLFNRSANW